mmetsp:Transcript_32938/g.104871  ORF Transcript_32938/g.104871 Transcript_32938/m.104871 type:complete len:244 (-) Transcript_32938:636-1367(-)
MPRAARLLPGRSTLEGRPEAGAVCDGIRILLHSHHRCELRHPRVDRGVGDSRGPALRAAALWGDGAHSRGHELPARGTCGQRHHLRQGAPLRVRGASFFRQPGVLQRSARPDHHAGAGGPRPPQVHHPFDGGGYRRGLHRGQDPSRDTVGAEEGGGQGDICRPQRDCQERVLDDWANKGARSGFLLPLPFGRHGGCHSLHHPPPRQHRAYELQRRGKVAHRKLPPIRPFDPKFQHQRWDICAT